LWWELSSYGSWDSITKTVAGISVGSVAYNDGTRTIIKQIISTGIIGTEDHFRDMYLTRSAIRNGRTGTQLDLKIQGVLKEIANEAVLQSKKARIPISDNMESVISGPRKSRKPNTPEIHSMQMDPHRIGALLELGEKKIKRITSFAGGQIDIKEEYNGKVVAFAPNEEALERA
jgi:polyribonucleotide nucleotidyltransferase